MTGVNREYKDRLFTFLFGREENREWTLSLYNAVNGSHYTDPEAIQFNTIRDILYMGMHNDVSFLIGDEMNLYEQQSTYNPNMPVRMIQYAGNLYESYIQESGLNKYSRKLLLLPAPKFIVFYNGTQETEEEQILRLSDSFPPGTKTDIEVTVRLLNINYGRNAQILQRCEPLGEYAWMIQKIREHSRRGQELEETVDNIIAEMPEDFLIKAFLKTHRAEVKGMLETEYDEAKVMEMFKREAEQDKLEARREGLAEGLAEGRAEGREIEKKKLFQLLLKMNASGEAYDIETLSVNDEELERLYRKYGISG